MKNVIVYGVEMTSFQEMIFQKYISNAGIAMNTKFIEQRAAITKEWLKSHIQ